MKKVLFLMFLLLLIVLGTANIKAQVRIGGNAAPNVAAVLDLNADDSATPAGNKGALALPRVSLASATAQLNGTNPIDGMLIYNTNAGMTNGSGIGTYYWRNGKWVLIGDNELLAGDSIVGTPKSGQVLVSNGTSWVFRNLIETVSFAVTCSPCAATPNYSAINIPYPSGCTAANTGLAYNTNSAYLTYLHGTQIYFHAQGSASPVTAYLLCLRPAVL